jgi:hypothetical protein
MWQRPEAVSPLRGFRFLLERMGDRIAEAWHALADAVAPPPKMTRQQVHDHLQAAGNLETLDAESAEITRQEHEAAKDEQIFRADQQTQQADLSLAQRFGRNATREVNQGREHAAQKEQDYGHELE